MLDKAIESGKEHRKSYRGSARFDKSCRCNGGCPYCRNNRLHNLTSKILAAEADIKDALENED